MRPPNDTPLQADEQIFAEALALSPERRREFVERRCGDANRARAESVLALLHAYEKDGAFLERPAPAAVLRGAGDDAARLLPEPEPGDHMGRYHLLERIGEGGFGIVYVAIPPWTADVHLAMEREEFARTNAELAEQRDPVRRRVALKLIPARAEHAGVLRAMWPALMFLNQQSSR